MGVALILTSRYLRDVQRLREEDLSHADKQAIRQAVENFERSQET